MEDASFTLVSDPGQVERVQRELVAVLQAAGIRLKTASALNVALGEWLENIIQYAYADAIPHNIRVHCAVAPDEIVLRIIDDGRPFDPCAYPAIAPAPDAASQAFTGRGIHLIRHLTDRMSYERVDGNNVLTLAKQFVPRTEL